MSRNRIVLFGNAPLTNRGCEAILRGTIEIVASTWDKPVLIDATNRYPGRLELSKGSDLEYIELPVQDRKWHTRWILRNIIKGINTPLSYKFMYLPASGAIDGAGCALLLGGDIYSMQNCGFARKFIHMTRYFKNKGVPVVLWGATIGPFSSTDEPMMVNHLNEDFKAIFARDPLTVEYLQRIGIATTIRSVPDPGFCLTPEEVPCKKLLFEMPGNSIGINISPIILRSMFGRDHSQAMMFVTNVITGVVDRFDVPVVMVPHVGSGDGEDFEIIERIERALNTRYRNRVCFVKNRKLNAAEIKWIISKLACLVAARAHAIIAAFSTCVPTVSLAYSTKARGINQWIFGHDSYVVEMGSEYIDKILQTLTVVLDKSVGIRTILAQRRGKILRECINAGNELRKVLGRN